MADIISLDHKDGVRGHDMASHAVDDLTGVSSGVTDLDIGTSQGSHTIHASLDALLRNVVPVQSPGDDGNGESYGDAGNVEDVANLQVDTGWRGLDGSGLS